MSNFYTADLIARCQKKGISAYDNQLRMKPTGTLERQCQSSRGVNHQALALGLKPLYDRAHAIYIKEKEKSKRFSKVDAIAAAKQMADGVALSRVINNKKAPANRAGPSRSSPPKPANRAGPSRSSPPKPVNRARPSRSSPPKPAKLGHSRPSFDLAKTCGDVSSNVRTTRAPPCAKKSQKTRKTFYRPNPGLYLRRSGLTPPRRNYAAQVADPSLAMPHSSNYVYRALSPTNPKNTRKAFLNTLTDNVYLPTVRGERHVPKVIYNASYNRTQNINLLTKPKSPPCKSRSNANAKLLKQFEPYSDMQNQIRKAINTSGRSTGSGVLRRKARGE